MSKATTEAMLARVDGKGRLTLGAWAAGKTFQIERSGEFEYKLTAMAVIPERELWLFNNPEALAMVREGLAQSARGEGRFIGSFEQFADDESEDAD